MPPEETKTEETPKVETKEEVQLVVRGVSLFLPNFLISLSY